MSPCRRLKEPSTMQYAGQKSVRQWRKLTEEGNPRKSKKKGRIGKIKAMKGYGKWEVDKDN